MAPTLQCRQAAFLARLARRHSGRSCRQRLLCPTLRSGQTRRWPRAAGLQPDVWHRFAEQATSRLGRALGVSLVCFGTEHNNVVYLIPGAALERALQNPRGSGMELLTLGRARRVEGSLRRNLFVSAMAGGSRGLTDARLDWLRLSPAPGGDDGRQDDPTGPECVRPFPAMGHGSEDAGHSD
jgi:hypothetical protein